MISVARRFQPTPPSILDDVAFGLLAPQKSLPPYLFYDDEGARLYEQITALSEYYPTRTERAIFEQHAEEIVAAAAGNSRLPLRVIELGAGTATKTQILLRAIVERQGSCDYLAIDVSGAALAEAVRRLGREEPAVEVRPLRATHRQAFPSICREEPLQFALFIGSSIGNYDDAEARTLLGALNRCLRPGAAFLLGTDMCRDPAVLVPAYDDVRGITAAFNKNVLARINRELGGRFDLESFRHVALWNAERTRVEMHLESLVEQEVEIEELGQVIPFGRGERIHTESSAKYDLGQVDELFRDTGFRRERTFTDPGGLFGVHLARVDRRSDAG